MTEGQKEPPQSKWGEVGAENTRLRLLKYLGSIMEAGGGHMTDVQERIVIVSQRFAFREDVTSMCDTMDRRMTTPEPTDTVVQIICVYGRVDDL